MSFGKTTPKVIGGERVVSREESKREIIPPRVLTKHFPGPKGLLEADPTGG